MDRIARFITQRGPRGEEHKCEICYGSVADGKKLCELYGEVHSERL